MKYIIKITTSVVEREKALKVRDLVFVKEQQVPKEVEYDEYDEHDNADHFIISTQEGRVFGTARLRAYGVNSGKVQRVAILSEYRGMGAGALLMEAVEQTAKDKGFHTLQLEAQLLARCFYERLGYTAQGKKFMDANIEHIRMTKNI
jgi:predicted GNAT family N-acyltransferase